MFLKWNGCVLLSGILTFQNICLKIKVDISLFWNFTNEIEQSWTLFRMGIFGATHGWGRRKSQYFWAVILVQVQWFGTGTKYKLEILHQGGKRVKTKSQKVLGINSYVRRSCRRKTGRGTFLPIPTLNRVKSNAPHPWPCTYLLIIQIKINAYLTANINCKRMLKWQ